MRAVFSTLLVALAIGAAGSARAGSIQDLPPSCRAFAWVPADVRDDTLAWNQLLSLASCLQDASIEHVSQPDELAPMVARLTRALAIPMEIYLGAIERGPGPVQLRAAYQLAMAHVALIVRARCSLADPALSAELEPMLERSARIAWLTFAVIDRAAAQDPTLARDPVAQNMVRNARAMLRLLSPPSEQDRERYNVARDLAR